MTRRTTILIPADDPQADDPQADHAGATAGAPAANDRPAADDAFPRERFGALIRRLPRYLRLAWGLAGEPSLPRSRRAGVLAAAIYLASPVDLVPGVVPVVGQLDDMAFAILALRAALRALDEPTRLRVLGEAGLTSSDLDRDLATVGLTARWLARRGVDVGARLMRLGGRAALAAGRTGTRVGVQVGGKVAATAGQAGSAAARRGADVAARGASVAGSAVARGAGSTLRSTRSTVGRLGGAVRRRTPSTGDRDVGEGSAPGDRDPA